MSWRGYLASFLLMAGVSIIVGMRQHFWLQGPGFLALFMVVPLTIGEVEWREAERRKDAARAFTRMRWEDHRRPDAQ